MKKVLCSLLLCAAQMLIAQDAQKIKIGLRIMPSLNIASVNDKDGTPSAVNFAADGSTSKDGNLTGVGLGLTLEYRLNENIDFSTGIGLTSKNFRIFNIDGGYSGGSTYKASYLQVPVLLKLSGIEVTDKVNMYFKIGPTISLRAGESIDGADGAHYWNMSHYLIDRDPTRGKNGNGKPMSLFNWAEISVFASSGVTLNLIENLDLYSGILFDYGLTNLVNSQLKFADASQTKVTSDVSWKSFLVGLELGINYKLK